MATQKAIKPIIKLKDFAGMGDSGIYWLDGFLPKTLNGQTILTQGFGANHFLDNYSTGMGYMTDPLVSVTQYQHLHTNQLAGMDSQNNIFDFNAYGTTNSGRIHTFPNSGQSFFCQGGSIFTTRLNNLIYSSSNYLGVGWVGKATDGSTSYLTDTGRDFTALGIGTGDSVKYVYNITKGTQYIVTGVTGASNETLTFAASPACAAGDWYIAFCDTRFTFGTTSDANLQYYGQPNPVYWNRQIILWNDFYYILNGNFIASLTTDESTWTSDILGTPPSIGNPGYGTDKYKKQLPTNHQAIMFDTNQDKMLVGTYYQGRGSLLLWDGYSDGWLSQLEISSAVCGMVRYLNGWVILIGTYLYFTDGYTLQYLDKIPDSSLSDSNLTRKTNMVYTEDGLIISNNANNNTRLTTGFYSYNIPNATWSYFPAQNRSIKGTQVYGQLFAKAYTGDTFSSGTPMILASFKDGQLAGTSTEICKIDNKKAKNSSAIFYIKLPQKMGISYIELNISPRNDNLIQGIQTNKIKVSYGQGLNNMFSEIETTNGNDITKLHNTRGITYRSVIGQEVLMTGGATGYDRTHIASIDDAGTVNEVLHFPTTEYLSAVPTAQSIAKKYDLYLAGIKTVSSDNLIGTTNLEFVLPTFYSDKIFIEVVFENQDVFPLDLYEINVW